MRMLPLVLAVLASCAVARSADAQTPGPWFVEVSGARLVRGWEVSQARHVGDGGAAWNATIGRQVLPWLAFTGDLGLLRVNEAFLSVFIPEDTWTIDDATHITLMTGLRFEPPVDFGLAPSLELGTGLGWLRWGDLHVTSMFGPGNRNYAGDHDLVWGSSAALRFRIATRRRRLAPQAVMREVVFLERGQPTLMTTFGLGLRY